MNEKKYETSDMGMAATLVTMKIELEGIDKTNPRRAVFIFKRDLRKGDISQIVDDYFANRIVLNPRELFDNVKALKSRIYNT